MTKAFFWPTPPRRVANRYEYGSLVFWAEGGGIYIIDNEPKEGEEPGKRIPVMLPGWRARMAMQRKLLEAVEKDCHVGAPHDVQWKIQYRKAVKGLLEAMEAVAKEAISQGDLTREDVQKYYRDHVATVKQTYQVPITVLPH